MGRTVKMIEKIQKSLKGIRDKRLSTCLWPCWTDWYPFGLPAANIRVLASLAVVTAPSTRSITSCVLYWC